MVVAQGDVWWADLGEPDGSGPGYRRPVIVVQADALNRSRLATAVVVPVTRNLKWADAPGNVLLTASATGLPSDSVAIASSVTAIDKTLLDEHVAKLPAAKLRLVLAGIGVVLGR
jgi:mRNA interferase MazF